MKIKVDIMTAKSYPCWLCKNQIVEVDENKKSYYWCFEELERLYKKDNDYPVTIEYEIIKY